MSGIVISGGSRGIGAAMARKFARQGFSVAVFSRSKEKLDELQTVIESLHPKGHHIFMQADAAKASDIAEFIRRLRSAWSQVTVLVNNAGLFAPGDLDRPDTDLEHMLQLNVMSAYRLTQGLLPMIPAAGLVINVCSIASSKAYPNGALYGITKHALLGFSRSLREECKDKGIRVTAMLPGATYTDSWDGIDLPESRFMDVEDVAEMSWAIHQLSDRTVVEEIILRPSLGDI